MATGQHRKPLTFGAGDHHKRTFQIDFFQGLIAFLGKADHAISGILERFEGAVEIDNPCHGKVFQCAGSDFGHGSRETCTATLRQNHPVCPKGFSGTNDRAEIVRIGESIQSEQQRRFIELAATVDQIRKIQGVRCCGLQSDALMNRTTCHLSQTSPGDLLHQNSGGLGITKQLHELWSTAHLTGAPDAMDRTTGLERRLGGMTAPEQIISHGISPMGSSFSSGLVCGLTIMAFGPPGGDSSGVPITETASSRTTVRETPVIRTMSLEALITIATGFRAATFKTAVFKAAVAPAAIAIATISFATVC